MSKIDIIIELYNIIHSSSNDDIVALLKDILSLAAHEHVLDSRSVKGLLHSMYDDIIPDDGVVSYVINEYSVQDIFSDEDIINYIVNKYQAQDIFGDDNIIDDVSSSYPIEAVYSPDEIKYSATSSNSLAELAEDYSSNDVMDFVQDWLDDNYFDVMSWLGNDYIMKYVRDNINLNDYLLKD